MEVVYLEKVGRVYYHRQGTGQVRAVSPNDDERKRLRELAILVTNQHRFRSHAEARDVHREIAAALREIAGEQP